MGKSGSGRRRTGSESTSRSERRQTSHHESSEGRAVTDVTPSSRRMSSGRDNLGRAEDPVPPSSDAGRSMRSRSHSAGSFVTALTAEPTEIPDDYRNDSRRDSRRDNKQYEETRRRSHRSDRHSTSERTRAILSDQEQSTVSRRDSGRSHRDSRKSSRSDRRDLTDGAGSNSASFPENQFSGGFPATYSKPYRPPGLAAEYYGDLGESVASQPGVRPNPPAIVTNAEQSHLIEPTIEPRPPPEPSSLGQTGAAASYFDIAASDLENTAPSTPPRPQKPSTHNDHGVGPITSPRPEASGMRPPFNASGVSAPPMAAGAAAGYFPVSDQGAMGGTAYDTPTRPPLAPGPGAAPFSAPAGYGGSSQGYSGAALFGGAALAGTAAGAYITSQGHNEHWHGQHHPAARPPGAVNGTPTFSAAPLQQAHRHKRRGPLGKLVDWFRDPEAVAEFEQYTEAIGVCKYCFDPWTSPADAPRKHHYRRRRTSSGSRYGSSTRVDKTTRYSSDEERRRRSGPKNVVVGGLAGYGAAKLGEAILKTNHDFDDTYSVKSGQPIGQSQPIPQAKKAGSSRRSRHHSSSEDLRSQKRESRRTKGKHHRRHDQQHSRRRDSSSSSSTSSSALRPSGATAMKAGIGAAGLAVGAAALDKKLRNQHKDSDRASSPSRKYFSKRVSPMHSYVDLSTSTTGRSGLAGFFTSPSANKRRGKKSKGFFNVASSSTSSSDADLAYGEGTVRRKLSNRRRDESRVNHDRQDSSKNMMRLLAEGTALAEESDRRKGKGREAYNTDELIQRSGRNIGRVGGSMTNESTNVGHEDGWYDINDDDDQSSSSVDTALAYGGDIPLFDRKDSAGPRSRHQRSEYDRRNPGRTGQENHTEFLASSGHRESYRTPTVAGAAAAAAAAAAGTAAVMTPTARSQIPPYDVKRPAVHESIPRLQELEPRPVSDSRPIKSRDRRDSHDTDRIAQSVRIPPHSVPLHQPQPITPIAPLLHNDTFRASGRDQSPPASQQRRSSITSLPSSQPREIHTGRSSARRASGTTRRRRESSPAKMSSHDSRRPVYPAADKPPSDETHRRSASGRNEAWRKSADAAVMAAAGVTAAGVAVQKSTANISASHDSRSSVDSGDERVAEIERELKRLYEEQQLRQKEDGKGKNQKPKGVDFAEPLLEGRSSTQATPNLRRKSSMKKTKDSDASSSHATQQERIARMAAQRVRSTPSPVHEDYGTFFVPKEIQEHLKEHNDEAQHKDEIEANVVEIVPGAMNTNRHHPFDPFTYRPFGLDSDDDPTLHPWPVPLLGLMEATPPGSQAHSVQGDFSASIPTTSAEEPAGVREPMEETHHTNSQSPLDKGDIDDDHIDAQVCDGEDDPSLFQSQETGDGEVPFPGLTGQDREEMDEQAEPQSRPSVSRVWTLDETEAERLERELPVVDDMIPPISRAWTIDDSEAEQLEHETSDMLGDTQTAPSVKADIAEPEPTRPQSSGSPTASGRHDDVYQKPSEDSQQAQAGYQSPFEETARGHEVTGDLVDRAEVLGGAAAEGTGEQVASREDEAHNSAGAQLNSPSSTQLAGDGKEVELREGRRMNSGGTEQHAPSGQSPTAFERERGSSPPSQGKDDGFVDLVEGSAETAPRSEFPGRGDDSPPANLDTASAFDSSDGKHLPTDMDTNYGSDPKNWERAPESRRTPRSEAGFESKSSPVERDHPAEGEEHPKPPSRSYTDDDTASLPNRSDDRDEKNKEKKPSSFFSNIFPNTKSDVSTSSKKSSRSSKSEELDDRGRDGQKERRKKRKSSKKEFDDVASATPESAGTIQRVPDLASEASDMKRDQSVDDGFVSAKQSPERSISDVMQREPFLEIRPEMPPPTVTGSQTGPSGVSGQDSMTESSVQPGTGADASVDAQEGPPQNDKDLETKAEAVEVDDGIEISNKSPPVVPLSASSRRLSAIRTSDHPSSPTVTSSPTAIPLHFRRPPVSPTNARFSMSSPIASPTSPLTTPRTRQGRPKSTEFRSSKEFRPLYLVERQNFAKTVATPETTEEYPSLPSSKTSSAHPSTEDLRAEAQAQEQFGYFSPSHINPDMFRGRRHSYSHWHGDETRRESPDYLDSRSATPVPGEHQQARERELRRRPKYEFHSPSELLQDPTPSNEGLPVDDEPELGSPLPSVVSTDAEQGYMSARSRSLSAARSRSVSRGRKAGSASPSASASWKDTLSGSVTAAIGNVAVAAVHALGINAPLENHGNDQETSTEAQPDHMVLGSSETGEGVKQAAGAEVVGATPSSQPEADSFHEMGDSPVQTEPNGFTESTERVESMVPTAVGSPARESGLAPETTVALPMNSANVEESNWADMAVDAPESTARVGSSTTRSVQSDLDEPLKHEAALEGSSPPDTHDPATHEDSLEFRSADSGPPSMTKLKNTKKDKKKNRNVPTLDQTPSDTLQDSPSSEAPAPEVNKENMSAADIGTPAVSLSAERSPFEDSRVDQPTNIESSDGSTLAEPASSEPPPSGAVATEPGSVLSIPGAFTPTEPAETEPVATDPAVGDSTPAEPPLTGQAPSDTSLPGSFEDTERTTQTHAQLPPTESDEHSHVSILSDQIVDTENGAHPEVFAPHDDNTAVPSRSKTPEGDSDPLGQAFEAAVQARGLSEGASLEAAYQAFQPDFADDFDVRVTPLATIQEESELSTPAPEVDAGNLVQDAGLGRKISKKEKRKEKKLAKKLPATRGIREGGTSIPEIDDEPPPKTEHPRSLEIYGEPSSGVTDSKDDVLIFNEPPNPFGNDFELPPREGNDPRTVSQPETVAPFSSAAEPPETTSSGARSNAADDEWLTGFVTNKKARKDRKGKKNKKTQPEYWHDREGIATDDAIPVPTEGIAPLDTAPAASDAGGDFQAVQPVQPESEEATRQMQGPDSDPKEPDLAPDAAVELSEDPWEMSSRKAKKTKGKSAVSTGGTLYGPGALEERVPPSQPEPEAVNESPDPPNGDRSPGENAIVADDMKIEPKDIELPASPTDSESPLQASEGSESARPREAPPVNGNIVEATVVANPLANDDGLDDGQKGATSVSKDLVPQKTSKKKSKKDKNKDGSANEVVAIVGQEKTKAETLDSGDSKSPESAMASIDVQGPAETTMAESQPELARDISTEERHGETAVDGPTSLETEPSPAPDKTTLDTPSDITTELPMPTGEDAPAQFTVNTHDPAPSESHVALEPRNEQQAPAEDDFFPMPTKKSKKDKKKKQRFTLDDLEAPAAQERQVAETNGEERGPVAVSEDWKTREGQASEDVKAGLADDQVKEPEEIGDLTFSLSSKRSKKEKRKKKRQDRLDGLEAPSESKSVTGTGVTTTEDTVAGPGLSVLLETPSEEVQASWTDKEQTVNDPNEDVEIPATATHVAQDTRTEPESNPDEQWIQHPSGPVDIRTASGLDVTGDHDDQSSHEAVQSSVEAFTTPPADVALARTESIDVERSAEPPGECSRSVELLAEDQHMDELNGAESTIVDPAIAETSTTKSPTKDSPSVQPPAVDASAFDTVAHEAAVQEENSPALPESSDKAPDEEAPDDNWGFPIKKGKKDKKKKRQSRLNVELAGPQMPEAGLEEVKTDDNPIASDHPSLETPEGGDTIGAIDTNSADVGEADWGFTTKKSKKDKKKKRRSELQTVVGERTDERGPIEQHTSEDQVPNTGEEKSIQVQDPKQFAVIEEGDGSPPEGKGRSLTIEDSAVADMSEEQRQPFDATTVEHESDKVQTTTPGGVESQEAEHALPLHEVETVGCDKDADRGEAGVEIIEPEHAIEAPEDAGQDDSQMQQENISSENKLQEGNAGEEASKSTNDVSLQEAMETPLPDSPTILPGTEATGVKEDHDNPTSVYRTAPPEPEPSKPSAQGNVDEDPAVYGATSVRPEEEANQDWGFTTKKSKKNKKKKRQAIFDDSVSEGPTAVAQIEEQSVDPRPSQTSDQNVVLPRSPAVNPDFPLRANQAPLEAVVEEEWAMSKKAKKDKKKKKRQSTLDEVMADEQVTLPAEEPHTDAGSRVQKQSEEVTEKDPNIEEAVAVPSETLPVNAAVLTTEVQPPGRHEADSTKKDAVTTEREQKATEEALPDLDNTAEAPRTIGLQETHQPVEIQPATDFALSECEVPLLAPVSDPGADTMSRLDTSSQLEDLNPAAGVRALAVSHSEQDGGDEQSEKSFKRLPADSIVVAPLHSMTLDGAPSSDRGPSEHGLSTAKAPTEEETREKLPVAPVLSSKSPDAANVDEENQGHIEQSTTGFFDVEEGDNLPKTSRKDKKKEKKNKKKRATMDQSASEQKLLLPDIVTPIDESPGQAESALVTSESPIKNVEPSLESSENPLASGTSVGSERHMEGDNPSQPMDLQIATTVAEEPVRGVSSSQHEGGETEGDLPLTSGEASAFGAKDSDDSAPPNSQNLQQLGRESGEGEAPPFVDNDDEASGSATPATETTKPAEQGHSEVPQGSDLQPAPEALPEDEWSMPTKKSKKSKKNKAFLTSESETTTHQPPAADSSTQKHDRSMPAEMNEGTQAQEEIPGVQPSPDIESFRVPISKKKSKKDKKKLAALSSAAVVAAMFDEASKAVQLPTESGEAVAPVPLAEEESYLKTEKDHHMDTGLKDPEASMSMVPSAEDGSSNATGQSTHNIPAEGVKDNMTKKARRQFEFNGSEVPPAYLGSSEPQDIKAEALERSASGDNLQVLPQQPAQEVDDMSDVSASTRERRKRRRSPPVWSGEEPEDLPNRRPLTPPQDQDIMSTALEVAAGLGFGAGESASSKKEIPEEAQPPARQNSAGWSFANLRPAGETAALDANRDSGVQFESPVMPTDQFPPTRDSGFIPSPAEHQHTDTGPKDVGTAFEESRPPRPRSPTSSTEDVSKTLPSGAVHHDLVTLETPRRKPSPVESTSKDRSSVLFASSPAMPTPLTMERENRGADPLLSPLRRSPSIHGKHISREELRQKGRAVHDSENGDELASNLIDRAAKAEVNLSTFGKTEDRTISPTWNALNTIREDPIEGRRQTPVNTSIGLVAAAAAAAAPRSSSRDWAYAKSLGRSKSRTSSLRNLRGASISPYNPASLVSSLSHGPVDESGAAKSAAHERDMADVYDGYGSYPGSPKSPTRPPSVRRRQSMQQIKDLEARLEQLASENRALAEAKMMAEQHLEQANLDRNRSDTSGETLRSVTAQLQERDAEIARLREEVASLLVTHEALKKEHEQSLSALRQECDEAQLHWQETTDELETLRSRHAELSAGMESIVRHEIDTALAERDAEIQRLHQDLEAARDKIRELQSHILQNGADDVVVFRDEDYFDAACQKLCQQVQGWVLRFSKFNDLKRCRSTNEVRDEKIVDRFDNAILDGTDVDIYLADRVKRRDVFMSVVMTMIWEYVFTRYLFGMDREQRQKLKQLEKNLAEVGPASAVHQWRALTLTLLSKRESFQAQRESDTEAVALEIFNTLSKFLPPPQNLEEQLLDSLRNVMHTAVDLSIEMRTQRAEYIMLPPLQPEYDTNGELARKVYFNASLMNERSGETTSNEELEQNQAVVRMVLFPLVVKKGDDSGRGDEEIVVCPAQVLVARPDKGKKVRSSARVASGGSQADRMSVDARSLRAVSTHSLGAMSGIEGNENMI